MVIVLPWPDKRLSPNARLHWRAKASVKADAREAAHWLTLDQLPVGLTEARAMFDGDAPISARITFVPPDARHRDDDNAIGAFKAARDGIADALAFNDRRLKPVYHFAEPEKPGRVEVRL